MALLTFPAPTAGWNTVSSIAEMPPNQAIVLDNIIPSTASVNSRKGYTSFSTGVGSGNVDSLFELNALSVSKMISAASGNIYDSSLSGTATLLASGFSSNEWSGTVFNAKLGLVNGVDAPQVYDGSTVSAMSVSGSGLTTTTLNSITTFKNRSYFTQLNSQDFWYSALSTLGGTLTKFPLGLVGNFGGNLIAIQTLTKDGGSGQDDSICFFMSTGEILIYEGTDPGADFVLTGVFFSGRPITNRAIVKFGADILVVSNEGYLPVSSLLPLSYGKDNGMINQNIKGAASSAVAAFPTNFGWQVVISPSHNLLIVNVPQSNNTFVQHVLNVNTLAWCRFTGINARCWCVFGGDLYFGGTNGTVYKYGSDYLDNGLTQTPQIYQSPYLKLTEGLTRTTAFRPRIRFDGGLTMTVSNSIDFKPFSTPYTISYSAIGAMWGATWGTSWSISNSIINFLNYNNIGYSTSVKLSFQCAGSVDFFETNFLAEGGNRI